MNIEFKKKAVHRLHILQGQIRGLEKMIESDSYCPDILTQTAAVQKSLASFNQVIMENHLAQHISPLLSGKKESQAIAELLRIYKLSNPTA